MSGEGKVVCVTGGSGFIATWLVKLLLDRGYTVNATVRTLNDPKKTEHLLALEGAKERLHLFKAELLEEGSFYSAVSGCDGVFHTASPCFLTCNDPQVELLDPAIKGTINVLNSCAKSPSVKRVILTSSVAAMLINNKPITPETEVDETWWSDPEFCLQEKKWYEAAKTMAEQAAWKFAKEKGIDLITICPGWMIGPSLQPTLNDSCTGILKLIGAPAYPNSSFGWVNVKDIANAHIQAFEIQSASGRYCIIGCLDRFSNVIKILQESYPTLQFPTKSFEAKIGFPPCKFSQQKADGLGINFIPIEVSLKETIESFKEKQLLPAI